MSMVSWCVVCALVHGAPGVGPGSQTPELLIAEGDALSPDRFGLVTRIDQVDVNDLGHWIAVVETDLEDPLRNSFLLSNGPTFRLREGQRVDAPSGAEIDSFGQVHLDNAGLGFWDLELNVPFLFPIDRGLYVSGTSLLLLEGDLSAAPGFPAPTRYIEPAVADINRSAELLLVSGVDIADDGTNEQAIVVLEYDDDAGTVVERVVAKTGDVLPGQTEAIERFRGPSSCAISDAGDVLYFVDLVGSTQSDQCVYLNQTLIAQEGQPAPIAGRKYAFSDGSLGSQNADMNAFGAFVFRALLDGGPGDAAVVTDEGVVARVGEPIGEPGGFVITRFGAGTPVAIGDNGAVFYQATFDTPDSGANEAIFANDRFVLRKGTVLPSGERIVALKAGANAFRVSDSGGYLIANVVIDSGRDALIRVELDELCPCDWNEDGALNAQDFFDYVNDVFAGSGPRGDGDFNGDGFANEQDFFDFSNCFFGPPVGCSIPG